MLLSDHGSLSSWNIFFFISLDEESETEEQDGKTLFVKNLNFETTEDTIKEASCKNRFGRNIINR